MGYSKKFLSIGDVATPFGGVMNVVSTEDMPPYVFQKLINYEPNREIGTLTKRKGYYPYLTGQSNLGNMKEWIDKNGGRQLFAKQSTAIKESVYAGGVYGALAAFTNDARTAGSTVNEIHPVIYEKAVRTGAGLNATTDLPMLAQYNDAVIRFPSVSLPPTIAAGKYLENQFYDHVLDSDFDTTVYFKNASDLTDAGLTVGRYVVYFSPVLDGYQKGFPDDSLIGEIDISAIGTATAGVTLYLSIPKSKQSNLKRITAIDVYVGLKSSEFDTTHLAHFLERIPLDGDGKQFLEIDATLTSGTPGLITIDDFANWKTFATNWFYIYDVTNDAYYWCSTEAKNGADLQITPNAGTPVGDSGAATLRFFSRWVDVSLAGTDSHVYPFLYDNYYKVLGSEMYNRIDIPSGDAGRSDLRYKYACEANKRYFIFGTNDNFGYYSVNASPDIIPVLNLIRPKWPVVGCVGLDKDALYFGKHNSARVTIISNTVQDEDQNFLEVGSVGQESIVKISDYEAAWMSYKGPYMIVGRNPVYIGEPLYKWWNGLMTDAEMESCVTAYRYKTDQIWFIFKDYTDTDFANGIIFVFDRKAFKRDQTKAWYYFSTDLDLVSATLNDDGHLLANDADTLADFDPYTTNASDESVSTALKMMLLKNQRYGKRANLSMKNVFVDYDSSDTPTVRFYLDGSGTPVALTLDANLESMIHYMAETFELEVITAASKNTVEINKIQLEFKPKRF